MFEYVDNINENWRSFHDTVHVILLSVNNSLTQKVFQPLLQYSWLYKIILKTKKKIAKSNVQRHIFSSSCVFSLVKRVFDWCKLVPQAVKRIIKNVQDPTESEP